jgi:hypothetical protein
MGYAVAIVCTSINHCFREAIAQFPITAHMILVMMGVEYCH